MHANLGTCGEHLTGKINKNNLTIHGDPIVWTFVITDIRHKDIRSISDTTLNIGVVLTRTPLPHQPIINVSFARRMPETQKTTGENRNGVLQVGDASELPVELTVNIVGEILISDLRGRKGQVFKLFN
jgi:hypothetical protein